MTDDVAQIFLPKSQKNAMALSVYSYMKKLVDNTYL